MMINFAALMYIYSSGPKSNHSKLSYCAIVIVHHVQTVDRLGRIFEGREKNTSTVSIDALLCLTAILFNINCNILQTGIIRYFQIVEFLNRCEYFY